MGISSQRHKRCPLRNAICLSYTLDVPRSHEVQEGAMPFEKRGSEEPGDQILDRRANRTDSDASSKDQGHTLDAQADIAGGRYHEPQSDADLEPEDEPPPARGADGGDQAKT